MTRYLAIYNDIKEKILSFAYKYGEKLPSKRVTAADYGVSVITAEHAYDLLFEEGFVMPKEKSGYFVAYKESEGFESTKKYEAAPARRPHISEHIMQSEKKEGISFAIYAKTARRVLSDFDESLTQRVPGYGTIELREAISAYLYNYRGIKTEPERIIIGAGAETLYGLIIKAVGREPVYGIEKPSYQKIAAIYEAEGIVTDPLKLGNDGIVSSELWKTGAGVLHITPYRSFPTGVTATAAKKAEYLRWSVERKGLIIEDDFESEFTPSRKAEDTLFSMDKEGRVIYVNTFTRTIGPFVRCAYMVIPERLSDLFKKKIGFYSNSVATLEQLILAELIDNGDFVRHINRVRRQRRESLKKS